MARQIILAFDVVNQAFVPNYNGSASFLPSFRQGKYNVKIYLVQPVADSLPGQPTYEAFANQTDYDGIRMGIWENSTGTLDDEDDLLLCLTDQLGWTYDASDADNPFWYGEFVTNTQEVADWIGSSNSRAAYFAVNLTDGSDLHPVFDQKGGTNITLYSATDGGGGVPLDLTGQVPLIELPVQFLDTATGELYALTRTSAGVLQFVWLNP